MTAENKEQEIFDSFLSESAELLAELEQNVIELENNPGKREIIDNIFRCAHSIKGNSGLFGLAGIKLLAHTLESLLSRIRDGEMEVNEHIIGIILKGSDYLKSLFNRLTNDSESANLISEEEQYIDDLTSLMEADGDERTNERLRSTLMQFLNSPQIKMELENNEPLIEMCELINKASPNLLKDKRTVTGDPLYYKKTDVSRDYYAIKAVLLEVEQENFADNQVSVVTNSLEALLAVHENDDNGEPAEILQELLDDIDMMYHDETGFDEILAGSTEEALEKYEKHLEKKTAPEQAKTESDSKATGSVISRQIKVDQKKLDKALNTVGELVTISEFFNFILMQFNEGKVGNTINSLKDAIVSLQELNESLSTDLYDIRKVPINEAFLKLPRIVRDTQVSVNKKVRLIIEGEDTMVDKSLIAKLETILVHMIRNSIDHGIENPSERRRADKTEEGTVSLTAKRDNSWIVINIADDGKGIDLEKLKRKALSKELLSEQEAESISDRELAQKIFHPGFSTAEKVTETSGRGVGMDIVHSYLIEMGGSIDLNNMPGKGISITLKIPETQTTLVKRGLAVAVGSHAFLIPIEMVLESFRAANGEIQTVEEKGEMVHRRGEIMSLIRLHELFDLETKITNPMEGLLVTVKHKNKKACFMVDFVIGQRQIIYKNLAIKTLREPSPFEGVSVYDGSRLAIILDVKGIITQIENY